MKLLSFNPTAAHTLEYYTSIQELPAFRHLEYQIHAAYEAGVGSDEAAAQHHDEQAALFKNAGRDYLSYMEEGNAHFCRGFIAAGHRPFRLAFAALVATVDGEPVYDTSEDGLESLSLRLVRLGLTDDEVKAELATVGERLTTELENTFPERFKESPTEIVRIQHLKRRIIAVCDYMIDDNPEHLKTVEQIDNALLDMIQPEVFETGHPENTEMLRRRTFGQLCAVLSDHGVNDPEKLTLFQFQSRIDYVLKKIEAGKPKN